MQIASLALLASVLASLSIAHPIVPADMSQYDRRALEARQSVPVANATATATGIIRFVLQFI